MGRKKRNRKRSRRNKDYTSLLGNYRFEEVAGRNIKKDFDIKFNYNGKKTGNKMKIGILTWATGDNSFGLGKNYVDFCRRIPWMISHSMNEDDRIKFIAENGDVDLILINPWSSVRRHEEYKRNMDMLVLPGGADLDPSNYGEAPSPHTGKSDPFKEYFFSRWLNEYIEAGVPTFGICLGFQMINVIFGGGLLQHIFSGIHQEYQRFKPSHEILYIEDGKIQPTIKVNSHHHQGVKPHMLGEGLIATAYSDENNEKIPRTINPATDSSVLVEGIIHKSLPVAGVQWHPEEFYDRHTFYLLNKIYLRDKRENKLKNDKTTKGWE